MNSGTGRGGVYRQGREWIVLAVCLIFSFIAYSRVLSLPYLSDDWCIVYSKADLFRKTFYRPLAESTFLLEERIWGSAPAGSHAVNIALHGLNSFFVFILSLQFLNAFGRANSLRGAIALLSALLFLLFPSHSETVSWLSARPDLLATLWCLVSLIVFFPTLSHPGRKGLLVSLLFFLLALMSKESAVCLPVIVFAVTLGYSLYLGKTPSREALRNCGLFVVVLSLYLLLRWWMLGSLISGYGTERHLNVAPPIIAKSLGSLFIRSFLPPFPYELEPILRSVMFVGITFGGIVGFAWMLYGLRTILKEKLRTAGAFLYFLVFLILIALAPVANLSVSLFSTDGERLLYLASVFSCILLANLFLSLIRKDPLRIVAVALCLTIYASTLFKSNENWRNAGQIFSRITAQITHFSQRGSIVILNLPDSVNGAFVFRNWVYCALQSNRDLNVLAYHTTINDQIRLIPGSDGRFDLALAADRDRFMSVNPTAGCLRSMGISSPGALRVENDCSEDVTILMFTQGRLVAIEGLP